MFAVSFVALFALAAPALPLAADDDASSGDDPEQTPAEPAKPAEPAPEQPAAEAPPPGPVEPGPVAVPGPGQTVGSPAAATPAPTARGGEKQDRGGSRKSDEGARKSAVRAVTIKDFEFSPKTINVSSGDTVTWTNNGPTGHSATADDKSFDTGIMSKGKSGSHTFKEAGTFDYICTPHPNMTAKVVVSGSGASGSDDGSPSATGEPSPESTGTGSSADTTSSSDEDSGELAATGYDAWLVALVGALLITGGYALGRRVRRTG